MADGKIRHQNHIIDSKAIQFIQNQLPSEWVARQMHPDYGIDLDVELFDYESNKCVTLGEHVFLQVKGTEHAQYGKVNEFGNTFNSQTEKNTIDVLKFSIDVPLLKLVERMGSGVPVLLIVVDLPASQAYHICLNDYIRHVLPEQCPNFRKQDSVTIYIPIKNRISNSIFMWYGKRSKMYALFQEIYSIADICAYSSAEQQIAIFKEFVDRIYTYDVWQVRAFCGYMENLYSKLIEMHNNNLISKNSINFLLASMEDEGNWEDTLFYPDLTDKPIKGYLYAQEVTCKDFLIYASGMSSHFEHELRHLCLPTKINSLLTEIAHTLQDRFE